LAYPDALDTDVTLLRAIDLFDTTLSAPMPAGATEINLNDTTRLPSSGVLRIRDPDDLKVNFVEYTGKTPTSVTGVTLLEAADFPAQDHPANASAAYAVLSVHHNRLKDSIINVQTALGLNPEGAYATVRERLVALQAPTYLTVDGEAADLGASRRLVAGSGISIVDGGAGGNLTISSTGGGGGGGDGKTAFERSWDNAPTAGAKWGLTGFHVEGPLTVDLHHTSAMLEASPAFFIRTEPSTDYRTVRLNQFRTVTNSSDVAAMLTTDPAKNSIIAYIDCSNGYAQLDSGDLMGVVLFAAAPSNVWANKTTASSTRCVVGVDNTGRYFVVRSDGTSVVAVDTGVDAHFVDEVRGSFQENELYVAIRTGGPGTQVYEQTFSTVLPRGIGAAIIKGPSSGTDAAVHFHGGYWRFEY
jgi:hypothetical protein